MRTTLMLLTALLVLEPTRGAETSSIPREPHSSEFVRLSKAKEYVAEDFPEVALDDLAPLRPVLHEREHRFGPYILCRTSTTTKWQVGPLLLNVCDAYLVTVSPAGNRLPESPPKYIRLHTAGRGPETVPTSPDETLLDFRILDCPIAVVFRFLHELTGNEIRWKEGDYARSAGNVSMIVEERLPASQLVQFIEATLAEIGLILAEPDATGTVIVTTIQSAPSRR